MNATIAKQPTTRQIAFNALTRKWQVVYTEDEVPASKVITQYYSGTLDKWVTIPQ